MALITQTITPVIPVPPPVVKYTLELNQSEVNYLTAALLNVRLNGRAANDRVYAQLLRYGETREYDAKNGPLQLTGPEMED